MRSRLGRLQTLKIRSLSPRASVFSGEYRVKTFGNQVSNLLEDSTLKIELGPEAIVNFNCLALQQPPSGFRGRLANAVLLHSRRKPPLYNQV